LASLYQLNSLIFGLRGNYPASHRKKKEITRNPEGSRVVADQVPIAAMICLEALLAAWCRLSFDRCA